MCARNATSSSGVVSAVSVVHADDQGEGRRWWRGLDLCATRFLVSGGGTKR
jgi:hypothetical protein